MSSHREEVNPLRPYYIPPTIGEPSAPTSAPSPNPLSGGRNATSPGYASKARGVLTDLDYNNYLKDSTPSMTQNAQELVDELLRKYASVLTAQPFVVAKMILQVRDQGEIASLSPSAEPEKLKKRAASQGGSLYDYADSDSEGDEPAFFTSNVPGTPTTSHSRSYDGRSVSSPLQSPRPNKNPSAPEQFLNIGQSDSIVGVISSLWQKDGPWGVWKGSNATFLYTILQSLLENWGRSFLSAILNVPDLGVKEDIDRLVDIASPYPWASLFVAGAAAVASGVLLAPLDLVRTRLILTPSSNGQRRSLATLRSLPSYFCPPAILVPTALHSLINPIFTLSTPLVLRSRFMIDAQVSPMTFSVTKFCASSASIFIRLPLETVLRRGHMAVLNTKDYLRALGGEQKADTIVPIGRYNGVLGTMYHIVSEEGTHQVPGRPVTTRKGKGKAKTPLPVTRKGQGLEGLWRGWKVSWWGLIGLWVASISSSGGEGEF